MADIGTESQILYDAHKKSKVVAYLLWFFPALIGIVGGHRLYTRQFKSGAAMLVAAIVGSALYLRGLWPVLTQSFDAARHAAETGQTVDPAAIAQPDEAALIAAMQDPLTLLGIALLGIITIWWIVDAFLIPGLVRRHNEGLVSRLSRR